MKRAKLPKNVEEKLMNLSRRRCCFCFGLNFYDEAVKGQIAHVDQDNKNNSLNNLAWMCLNHHNEYDGSTSQSKGLTKNEAIRFREKLYK